MKLNLIKAFILTMTLSTLLLVPFQNCSKMSTADNSASTFYSSSSAGAPASSFSRLVPVSSSATAEFTRVASLVVQPNELVVGSQVKWFGIFPTTTLSNETIDSDRFKMMLQELQGRTNIVSILYVSEQGLALARSKGLVSQRKLSALALFEGKIAAAESLGFSVAVELTPVFFDFDVNTLHYDLRKFKNNFQTEWSQVSAVIKKHPKVNWFYPFDEPYWNAKSAQISYPVMKAYLDQMNSMIKSDFPDSKIVFIEAFTVVNEDFQIPVKTDYVGMDCYGNFDNCYGESIPSYYRKLAAKMTVDQKFIIIPDAFDFKGGDENGVWQNNVINHSKKYLAFSRENPRVEAIIFFLYNTPLDKNLNIENLASTRQGSLLNAYYDQVSLQNKSVIGQFAVVNPNVNISYLDKDSAIVNTQTTDQNPNISISPKSVFDLSFSRPLVAGAQIECTVIDPEGSAQKCDELMFRQARYNANDLKKGEWVFKFKINNGTLVERKIKLIDPSVANIIVPVVGPGTGSSSGGSSTVISPLPPVFSCGFSSSPNGWPSAQRGPSDDKLGVIVLPYTMVIGTGSGVCEYDLAVVGSVNPGTNFNVTGSCTDPKGNRFSSKGSFWPVFGSSWPATTYNLMAGMGGCGTGTQISMNAVANLATNQVGSIVVRENSINSNSSRDTIIATGTSGTYTGKNPFGTYDGWSVVKTLTMPEGSVCTVTANPWGPSQEVLSAKCSAAGGGRFTLTGMGPRGGVAAGVGFELEGVAQDGKTFDHFYKTGVSTWVGTWLNKLATGYSLSYADSSGNVMGGCSLGNPAANGEISGTCLLRNTQFEISGNIGSADSNNTYQVNLAGEVSGIKFTALIVYNATKGNGSGTWKASDGASGSVSATPIK